MLVKAVVEFILRDKASQPASQMGKSFGGLGSKIKGLINPLTIAIATFTTFGVALVKQFNKFTDIETKMVNVGNLYGATRDEVNGLTTELIDLSRTAPQSLDDMATSLFDVVSAGVPAAESVQFLGEASKLATAGVTSTAVAVDGLTSAMNAYGIEFSKAGEVSDKFFAAQQKGKTTIAELSGSIGQVAPIAASAGVSLDELLGSVSALTLNGIKTSEAATQMKAALSNIIKPTQQAAELADKLGLNFNTQALRAKGLSGFLKEVSEKTGGNTDAMAQLFGSVEALNAVLALSKNEFKALDEVQKAVTESAGSTDKAYKENLKTFDAQWKLIGNNIDALWSGLIRTLIPAVTAVLSAFNKMFNAVNTGIGKLQNGWSKFKGFFKKNNKEIEQSSTETADAQINKEIESLEKKKALEDERVAAIREKRAEEVAAILASMDEKDKKEEELSLTSIDRYEAELAEKKALREVDEAEQLQMLENLLNAENLTQKQKNKLSIEASKLRKSIRENEEKETADNLEKMSNDWKDFYGAVSDAKSVEDAFKQMGEGLKKFLIKQIIAWMATESAKASAAGLAAAIPSFGASLITAAGQVAGIAAAGAAAVATVNSVKFAQGGIVPGSSFTGDKVPAFVNSGEMVLNRQQQSNLGERLFNVANTPANSAMAQSNMNNHAVIKKLDEIQRTLMMPTKMNIPANDLSKATFNRQKSMLRRGEISNRGR